MNWFRRALARPDGREEPSSVLALRAVIVLIAIVGAYHNSLLTLVRNLAANTPLAYLGLVPVIALGLALLKGRRRQSEPNVHDRYLDYIIGLPLVLFALAVVLVGPVMLSTFYWRWRLDMLSLPVFAAGAVTLVFGVRAMSRVKLPIAFLLLAWPLPYTVLLGDWVGAFSDATVGALRHGVALVPVAQPVVGGDGSLFEIANPAEQFVVSVGSACAGVNGSLGFALVGGAVTALARGRFIGKLGWLVAGLAVTWLLNVIRILVIFAVGAAAGQELAISALHPFFGLITFNIGIIAMVLAMPLFRLRIGPTPGIARPAGGAPRLAARATSQLAARAAALSVASKPQTARRFGLRPGLVAIALVVATATLMAEVNSDREHELVTADLGEPRIGAFSPALAQVAGWTPSLTDSYPWVRQYFGDGSTWNRYTYLSTANAANSGKPPAYISVDVITTYDLGSFAAYGLEACYGFHNYRLISDERVHLGAGIAAKAITYSNPATGVDWTAIYWEWPVDLGNGKEEYERFVLNASSTNGAQPPTVYEPQDAVSDLQFALASLLSGPSDKLNDPDLAATRDLLVGFGQAFIQSRTRSAVRASTR